MTFWAEKCKRCGRLYAKITPLICKCGCHTTLANTEIVEVKRNIFGRLKEVKKDGEQDG